MQRLIAKDALLQEFTSPGEVMPLLAHPCGVIGRVGQTEGSHDLARLAGFFPSGIICEILNEKGALIRGSELAHFSDIHDMPIISVAAIRDYRLHHEAWAREIGSSEVETKYGKFKVVSFFDDVTERTHLAFLAGESLGDKVPLVRIHSECVTGDIFGSKRCDCGLQFESALRMLAKSRDNGGGGALIYLRQEGRGIGLSAKLESYNLQDSGLDTVEANVALGFSEDGRDYRIGGAILNALGLVKIRLLTNNPSKIAALESCGITITERVPLIVPVEESAKRYLQTKKEKLGHLI
jgi:3,4-dihydroxy 2-butanone 4-phosphate synthase/GTP cyclohydrolase II